MPESVKSATENLYIVSAEYDSDGALHQTFSTDPKDGVQLE